MIRGMGFFFLVSSTGPRIHCLIESGWEGFSQPTKPQISKECAMNHGSTQKNTHVTLITIFISMLPVCFFWNFLYPRLLSLKQIITFTGRLHRQA